MVNDVDSSHIGKRPTLRDVGELAGVDRTIVSRVINGDTKRVSPATHDRIMEAVAKLGYRPNSIARSLSLGRTGAIGCIIPAFRNIGYASMIEGIERAAFDADVVVVIAESGDDDQALVRQAERLSTRVDGLIVASVRKGSAALERLKREGFPIVLMNRRGVDGLRSVIGHDEVGAELAVRHLVELGHRRIAHLAGPAEIDTSVRRREGFELATAEASLDPRLCPVLVVEPGINGGADGVRRLFGRPESESCSAIFAVNLMTAIGAVGAARELGLNVPSDLSIVGFDDHALATFLDPPLTTISMPHEVMGSRAVGALLEVIDGHKNVTDDVVQADPRLVVRGSTATNGQASTVSPGGK